MSGLDSSYAGECPTCGRSAFHSAKRQLTYCGKCRQATDRCNCPLQPESLSGGSNTPQSTLVSFFGASVIGQESIMTNTTFSASDSENK